MTSLILMLVFALMLAIFAIQNTTNVQLHFLWWTSQNFSLSVLVLLSTAVGIILALFVSIPTHTNRRKKLKQRERELAELRDAISKH
jgi:putative membrane protein